MKKKFFLRRNRKVGVHVGRAVLFCVYRKKDFLVLTAEEIFEEFFCVGGNFFFTADSAPLGITVHVKKKEKNRLQT
jgi:hypothetical protein